MISDVLEGPTLTRVLSGLLPQSRRVIVISAYITAPAVQWLSRFTHSDSQVSVVARFRPADILSGASSIEAAELILERGWDFRVLENLHAKIYLIDDEHLFVGSANLTANGLMLYGQGNLECCVQASAIPENRFFVRRIVDSATPIHGEQLLRMKELLALHQDDAPKIAIGFGSWPKSILPTSRELWVADFPWMPLVNDLPSCDHDIELFGDSQADFIRSKVFSWLLAVLNEKESGEIYFGELSAVLHSALTDDPMPYRKNIKQLLVNLLSFCSAYGAEHVRLDRPSYSERIRLVSNGGRT